MEIEPVQIAIHHVIELIIVADNHHAFAHLAILNRSHNYLQQLGAHADARLTITIEQVSKNDWT